jgi:predicted kinase
MRTLIPLAGLPGSGKSTIARALAERLGVEMVGVDRFKREVVDPVTLSEGLDPPHVRWMYYQLALDYIFSLFENGAETVVMDEMFHVGCLRERIEEACRERGIPVRWIEVRCSDAEVERRFAEHPREGHILTTEQLCRIRAEVARVFDEFPCGTDRLVVTNAGSVSEAVHAAFNWVREC